ncbi:MAG TPA: hypothetical protein VFR80_11215 [Pyrinomonadaceae bacterium]|nr:hypothetical protein [Pyrinomonadaceae bacterium]
MTDDEYQRLLNALAAKHITGQALHTAPNYLTNQHTEIRNDLEAVSAAAHLLKVVQARPNDPVLLNSLREQLLQTPPIERTKKALEDTGLLAALEDANPVVFAELRREAIPQEDIHFLIKAGYTNEEIEVLLLLALHKEHFKFGESVSRQLEEAAATFKSAVEKLTPNEPAPQPSKRKIFNGIGKVLGGSIAGLGNALAATGTILVPNPGTAAGAIASAAVAIPAIMSGIGDLRGE